jgi:signal transduction histidine kinase
MEMALGATSERNRELAGRLIALQDQERTRIARDLHDDIIQRVASLSIGLSAAKRQLGGLPASVVDELSTLQRQTMTLSSDLRQLSQALHPDALERLGLIDALRARCQEVAAGAGLHVSLNVADGWQDLPDDASLCLYRVGEEALLNVARHARAASASITLSQHDGHITMRVADDGRGFERNALPARAGLGLASMDERARMLGGRFEIRSTPAGTEATVTLPVRRR